jgi:hypothetical protein
MGEQNAQSQQSNGFESTYAMKKSYTTVDFGLTAWKYEVGC